MFKNIILASFLLLFCSSTLLGHGDLHERILATSELIEFNPDSSYLYFKRAKLFFQHEQYEKALSDLKTANNMGYEDKLVDLYCAKANNKLNKHNLAIEFANKILDRDSDYVNAFKIKAKSLASLGNHFAAALAFESVIEKGKRPLSVNYLDASEAWFQYGTELGKSRSIEILDLAIEAIGSGFNFLNKKVDLFTAYEDYDHALMVQNEIIASLNRKESAYHKASKICLLQKDYKTAEKYIKLAIDAIDQLPDRIKYNSAMKQLKLELLADQDHINTIKQR